MNHPYIPYTNPMPEFMPCSGVDPDFDEKKIIAAFDRHLKSITERNKKLIPADLRAWLMANPRRRQ